MLVDEHEHGAPTLSDGSNQPLGSRLVQRVARRPLDTTLRLAALVAASLQFVNLLGRSAAQYEDYALTVDFALFHQAWWELGQGNLDPYSTVTRNPFWKVEFNLTFWPLALLHVVSSSPFTLLVVQDCCIALSTLIAALWVCDAVALRLPTRRFTAVAIVLGTLLALLLDPFSFEAAYFDYHAEAMMLVFLLLAGRALWNSRRRSPVVWALLACLTASVGALLAVGLGLGAAVSAAGRRRSGLVVAVTGLVMIGVIAALGANQATLLGPSYGYLTGDTVTGNGLSAAFTIAAGVVRHPSIAASTLWSRREDLGSIFASGGVLGVLSGWATGVAVLGLLANALNVTTLFVQLTSGGFQNLPIVVFLLVGSALSVAWLTAWEGWSSRRGIGSAARGAGRLLGLGALTSSLLVASIDDPGIGHRWMSVWPPGAQILARINAMIPENDQVVVSQGVIGRFAGRREVVPYIVPNQAVPLRGRVTWFVISPPVGIETIPVDMGWQALSALQTRYHGELAASDDGVAAVIVHRSEVPGGVVYLPPTSQP